jgi:hypothetical protein
MFVFLFFDWYRGGAELSGSVGNLTLTRTGISGWDALTDLAGFLIILSGVSGIALVGLAATGQRVNIPVRRGMITALLGTLAVLLILWRMVAGTPTLKVGIFLGLAAAVGIAVGALMALAEDGWEPLVAVPGGRMRAASAGAPSATPTPAPSKAPAATRSKSSGGSATRKRSSTKGSPTKRSTTRKSSSSGSRSRSGSGAKRSSGSRSSSTRSRSSSTKDRGSSRSSSRAKSSRPGGNKRSTGGKK